MKSFVLRFLMLVPILFCFSCEKDCTRSFSFDIDQVQLEKDITTIENYLNSNGLSAEKTDSGIHYIIDEEGSGDFPCLESRVTVNYRGYLTSGQEFDSNSGISFNLTGVIDGWKEGMTLFRKGGSGTLLIPSGLGYGPAGIPGTIPGNSVLIFDVELISF